VSEAKSQKVGGRLFDVVAVVALVGTAGVALAKVAGAITVANVGDMIRGRGRERT
jgi:hypothetical protein